MKVHMPWYNVLIHSLLLALLSATFIRPKQTNTTDTLSYKACSVYAPLYGGMLIHEVGHWVVGTTLYRCNGIFYCTPWISGGAAFYYGEKAPLKAFHNLIKGNYTDIPGLRFLVPSRDIRGLKGIAVYAAGPFTGIATAALIPPLNTFYNELKRKKSATQALKATLRKPYINSTQNDYLTLGALLSCAVQVSNLVPLRARYDGAMILECLNMNTPIVRGGICISLGLLGIGALLKQ